MVKVLVVEDEASIREMIALNPPLAAVVAVAPKGRAIGRQGESERTE